MNIQHSTSNEEAEGEASVVNDSVGEYSYDLEERLLNYGPGIIRLVERMPETRTGRHVSGQLLRSGTSPLPNHGEAQAAESIADFIHKLKICLKELRESYRWLLLIGRAELLPEKSVASSLRETEELIKIFVKSIRTATARRDRSSSPTSTLDVGC